MKDVRTTGMRRLTWREWIKNHARKLRKNQTEYEAILWEELRNRKFEGVKFLRQHPIIYSYYRRPMYFIADFYCAEKCLVIELDGPIHRKQKEYDEQRDFILQKLNISTLRIKNEEFIDLDKVKQKILKAIE